MSHQILDILIQIIPNFNFFCFSAMVYKREYKPSGYKAMTLAQRRNIASAARAGLFGGPRSVLPPTKTIVVTPGYTRTGGRFARAKPGMNETKFNDSTFAQTSATAGGLLTFTGAVTGTNLCLIPQGTTDITRIGNRTMLKQIRIKGHLAVPTTAVSGDRIRVMLIQDHQTNGAAATVTDVLQVADENSFLNMDNTTRFRVIKDKVYDLNPQVGIPGTSTLPYFKSFKMSHKANCRIDWSSTTGAITELRSESYFVLVISQAGTSTITGQARVYFQDP